METYAAVLAYAIPGFLVLMLIESLAAKWKGVQVNNAMDVISSLSSGMSNTLKSLMGLSVVIISYDWLVSHLAVFELQATALVYVLAFIGLDFKGYWTHRWEHHINLFWNRHIIHHSSEEFNLACALRQEISAVVGIFFFLYIPLAIIGVPTKVVAVVAPIHLFSQFWYHTRLIDRMGFLEHIIVTPSHHRVHHAINDIYLDRNFAQIFIVWDKWFGTFQEELAEEPAVYGTKKPAQTWNPFLINFMHLWALVQDAWRTQSWWDKLRLWFMPTGWRPADVAEKYPISYYKTAAEQIKYDTHPSLLLKGAAYFHLLINLLLMFHFMHIIGDIELWQIILYGSFLMISIFTYTSLMDRHIMALVFEVLRLTAAFFIVYRFDSWFNIEAILANGSWWVLAYFALSLLATVYFLFGEKRPESAIDKVA